MDSFKGLFGYVHLSKNESHNLANLILSQPWPEVMTTPPSLCAENICNCNSHGIQNTEWAVLQELTKATRKLEPQDKKLLKGKCNMQQETQGNYGTDRNTPPPYRTNTYICIPYTHHTPQSLHENTKIIIPHEEPDLKHTRKHDEMCNFAISNLFAASM